MTALGGAVDPEVELGVAATGWTAAAGAGAVDVPETTFPTVVETCVGTETGG
jgi:hypothetical protein